MRERVSACLGDLMQNEPVTFVDCLRMCTESEEFVREYERLTGAPLVAVEPIHQRIDEATGADVARFDAFAKFVFRVVWEPFIMRAIRNTVLICRLNS